MNWEDSEMHSILKLRMAQFPLSQAVKAISTAVPLPAPSMVLLPDLGNQKERKGSPQTSLGS